jgi:septum formation protein
MTAQTAIPIVLGSRSPRRLELLSHLVARERIIVLPPTDPEEPGFQGLHEDAPIRAQLLRITRLKNVNVRGRVECPSQALVLTADTVIVAGAAGAYEVLGQPNPGDDWKETVRQWFHAYYFGQTHRVLTAVVISDMKGHQWEHLEETRVTMRAGNEALLEWYLDTQEPLGKAGGYALQGAGSVFITHVAGSLSNVVGLPLEAVSEMLQQAPLGGRSSC